MSFGHPDSDISIWAGIGVVFGFVGLFKGFKNLKLKRLIENIPTSSIRSLPMGFVEITGKGVKTFELSTPFSNFPCVFFQYLVEEYRSSGKSGHWATIKRYTSPLPFLVDDGTGSIYVNPGGAQAELKSKNVFTNQFFNTLPVNAKKFLDMNGISYTGFLGFQKKMRLTEYFIAPGSPVYVLGTARHQGGKLDSSPEYSDKLSLKKEMVIDTLKKLKKSDILFKKYDLNKDGQIDDTEWQKARDDVIKWIDYKVDSNIEPAKEKEEAKVEIGLGNEGQPFFISDRSQQEVLAGMFWKSTGYIIGGAVLIVVCSAILLSQIF